MNPFFTFACTPAGQALLAAALNAGGTIVQDIAEIVHTHALQCKSV